MIVFYSAFITLEYSDRMKYEVSDKQFMVTQREKYVCIYLVGVAVTILHSGVKKNKGAERTFAKN